MSGIGRIRKAVANLGEAFPRLASFAGINADQLEAFAKRGFTLPAQTVDKIVSFTFNDLLVYDADRDELRSPRRDIVGLSTVYPETILGSVGACADGSGDLPALRQTIRAPNIPALNADEQISPKRNPVCLCTAYHPRPVIEVRPVNGTLRLEDDGKARMAVYLEGAKGGTQW